jgi:hypothetical protein
MQCALQVIFYSFCDLRCVAAFLSRNGAVLNFAQSSGKQIKGQQEPGVLKPFTAPKVVI